MNKKFYNGNHRVIPIAMSIIPFVASIILSEMFVSYCTGLYGSESTCLEIIKTGCFYFEAGGLVLSFILCTINEMIFQAALRISNDNKKNMVEVARALVKYNSK